MDRFDLHWPNSDASFLTDGRRCRIVWRSAPGRSRLPGGSIDNNALCKKRLADSLALAPDLLGDLKSRGYTELAAEIEGLAASSQAAAPDDRVRQWLDALPGDAAWETAAPRRGKTWIVVAQLRQETFELRAPTGRKATEWVLRRSAGAGKPQFIVAQDLRGIFSFLLCAGEDAGEDDAAALIDEVLAACAHLDHSDVSVARDSWRND